MTTLSCLELECANAYSILALHMGFVSPHDATGLTSAKNLRDTLVLHERLYRAVVL